jgi:type IV pilus assembly protein PilF
VTTINGILIGSAAFLLTAGCMSSTTRTGHKFETSDDAAEQYYQLGARYYTNGSYELARERLIIAIDIDPKMGKAHTTLALTYEQLGNNRLALAHYDEAVRVAPKDTFAVNAYAGYLCRQRRFDDAEKQFNRALKIPENDSRYVVMTNAGACMTQKPDYGRAEKYFRDALQERSTYGEALLQLAALKHKTGDNLHARAFLQRYHAGNKTSAATLYLGIQVENDLGDDRASTDYANQLLSDFPNSVEARRLLDTR